MLARIGFFHFAENYGEPFHALEEALAGSGDATGSLIVLPEAFNNGRAYYDQPRMQPRFSRAEAMRELTRIASQHQVAFVAGLLDPPNNSAFWVDHSGGRLLRHKTGQDGTGNYQPCEGGCDFGNPAEYQGLLVGVLICNDIDNHVRTMAAELDARDDVRRVICIPGCMASQWFGSGPLPYDYWKGKHVVVANSNAHGCGSFISNVRGERYVFNDQRNQIVLKTWGELDSSQW